jgi:hypothetical protein
MRRTRTTMTLATAVLGLAALTACSGSDQAGTIQLQNATSTTTAADPSASSTDADPSEGQGAGEADAGPGCPADNAKIPAGARQVRTTVDLDNDGRVDTLWLSDSRKGVRTASGATFSQPISNGGGPQVSIRAIAIGDTPVVMENGRQAYVSAVVDCALVETKNKQGEQYSFDLGFTDPGTNYGCATIKGERQLVGLAVETSGMSTRKWQVEQTAITLKDGGKQAVNGDIKVVNSYSNANKKAALNRVTALSSAKTCGKSETVTLR